MISGPVIDRWISRIPLPRLAGIALFSILIHILPLSDSWAATAGIAVIHSHDRYPAGGEYPIFQDGGLVLSIPDAIARVLEKAYLSGDKAPKTHKTEYSLMGEKCPECGQTVSFEEGCMMCHFCGFNKCG